MTKYTIITPADGVAHGQSDDNIIIMEGRDVYIKAEVDTLIRHKDKVIRDLTRTIAMLTR